eukprot:446832_1
MGNCMFRSLCSCCMNNIDDYKPIIHKQNAIQPLKSSKADHYHSVDIEDTEKKIEEYDYIDIQHIDSNILLVVGYIHHVQNLLHSEYKEYIFPQSIINIICKYHHPSTQSVFQMELSFMEDTTEMVAKINQIAFNIKQMFLNGSSLFFMDINQHICVYGDNSSGKLGILPKIVNDYFNHKCIEPVSNPETNAFYQKHQFRVISSSSIHTKRSVAVSVNNDIYGYGYNGYYHLFGTQTSVKNSHIVPGGYLEEKQEVFWPTLVPIKYNIIDIRLGDTHSLFLTDNGKVLGCGKRYDGRIPVPFKTNTETPIFLECLSNETIVKIRCGGDFSLVLNNNGVLKAFGVNGKGQLGNGNTHDMYPYDEPIIIEVAAHEPRIKTMECGTEHVCCLDTKGFIYCWGFNEKNQCFIEHNNANNTKIKVKKYGAVTAYDIDEYIHCVLKPTHIELPNSISKISCGGNSTLIMDFEMNLYFCGDITSQQYQYGHVHKYDIKKKQNTEVVYDILKYDEFKDAIDNREIVDVMLSTGYRKEIYLVVSND